MDHLGVVIGVVVGAFAVVLVALAVFIEKVRRARAREKAVRALEKSVESARARASEGSTHGTLGALAKALWTGEAPLDARVARVQADVLAVIRLKMARTVAIATLEVTCACGAATRVPSSLGGRSLRCKSCGGSPKVLVAPLAVREALDVLFARFREEELASEAPIVPTPELTAAIDCVRDWLIEASKRSKKTTVTMTAIAAEAPEPKTKKTSARSKKTKSGPRVVAAAKAPETAVVLPGSDPASDLDIADIDAADIDVTGLELTGTGVHGLVLPEPALDLAPAIDFAAPDLDVPDLEIPPEEEPKLVVEEFELAGSGVSE